MTALRRQAAGAAHCGAVPLLSPCPRGGLSIHQRQYHIHQGHVFRLEKGIPSGMCRIHAWRSNGT